MEQNTSLLHIPW